MFAARKLLRRMLADLYVKEFDTETHAPRYRNTLTGKVTIQKPNGLGSEELQYENRWVIMTDDVLGNLSNMQSAMPCLMPLTFCGV